MKIAAALLLASCSAMAQFPPCSITMESAREKLPLLASLPDHSFVEVVHQLYYKDIPLEQLASALCVKMPPPFVPRDLGALDRWRYNSCQSDAAQAPTQQGVQVGLRLCREKFGQ